MPDDPQGPNTSKPDGFSEPPDSSSPEPVAVVPPINVILSTPFFEPVAEQDIIPIRAGLLRRHNILVLKVKGNSMIEDNLFEGDHVIMETRDKAREGELVVALIGNEVALRRFHRHEDRIRFESAHPCHEAIIFDEKDVAICGVVVGILRRYAG